MPLPVLNKKGAAKPPVSAMTASSCRLYKQRQQYGKGGDHQHEHKSHRLRKQLVLLKRKGYGKITHCQPAARHHRAKSMVLAAQPVRNANENATANHTDGNPANGANPFVVYGKFYKISNGQYQDGDADFIDQVFPDEFFKIRIALEKRRLFGWRFGWFHFRGNRQLPPAEAVHLQLQ